MESTLAIHRNKLRERVGFHLGYGRGETAGENAWSTKKALTINELVDSGLRRFYQPDLGGLTHEWSFLKPTGTIPLASGDQEAMLPDDFGSLNGDVLVTGDTSTAWQAIKEIGAGKIRELYSANPTSSGDPQVCAVVPLKETTYLKGQRYSLSIYPQASQDHTLQFSYNLLPGSLTTDRPYPYGGAQHAETILASCIAAAEFFLDGIKGACELDFQQQLAASVVQDRRLKPAKLGYNGDCSDDRGRSWMIAPFPTATIGGVSPV